ncbi:sugar transferase [Terrisporobacter sp.]
MRDNIVLKSKYINKYNEEEIMKFLDYSIVKSRTISKVFARLFDVILAVMGCFIGIPLIFIFGILIKIEDGGPVFYKQERVGMYGKKFILYKLRSMKIDAEKYGIQWAAKEDNRILKIGKIIRRTRIDEIPQLFNIIKGDMSVIGPRPERPDFTYQFYKEIPGFINRLTVKPGLTGFAQVNGGYECTPEEKLKLDLFYIKNKNIIINIKIILKTIKVLLTADGAR